MHSSDACTITNSPSCQSAALEHGHDLRTRPGGRGWKKGSGSVHCMRSTSNLDSLNSTIHKVGARTAMHMDVDEARRDVTALGINDDRIARRSLSKFPDEVDLAIMALDFGIFQQPIG